MDGEPEVRRTRLFVAGPQEPGDGRILYWQAMLFISLLRGIRMDRGNSDDLDDSGADSHPWINAHALCLTPREIAEFAARFRLMGLRTISAGLSDLYDRQRSASQVLLNADPEMRNAIRTLRARLRGETRPPDRD